MHVCLPIDYLCVKLILHLAVSSAVSRMETNASTMFLHLIPLVIYIYMYIVQLGQLKQRLSGHFVDLFVDLPEAASPVHASIWGAAM